MNESGNELPDRGVYHGNSMSDVFADGDILNPMSSVKAVYIDGEAVL